MLLLSAFALLFYNIINYMTVFVNTLHYFFLDKIPNTHYNRITGVYYENL